MAPSYVTRMQAVSIMLAPTIVYVAHPSMEMGSHVKVSTIGQRSSWYTCTYLYKKKLNHSESINCLGFFGQISRISAK